MKVINENKGYFLIPVAPGELFDKISVLEIKLEELVDEEKLNNVRKEYSLLKKVFDEKNLESKEIMQLAANLKDTNKDIWDAEDALRECWKRNEFGKEYVRLTTLSHKKNDERSRLKRKINTLLKSEILEEKSHQKSHE